MQIYETEETKKIEDDICAAYCRIVGLEWTRYHIERVVPDHVLKGERIFGNGKGYAETKRRYSNFRQYPLFKIDESKIKDLIRLETGILLVGFDDYFGLIPPLSLKNYTVGTIHRRDRGDPFDKDRAACFKWEVFKIIGERLDQYALEDPLKRNHAKAQAS